MSNISHDGDIDVHDKIYDEVVYDEVFVLVREILLLRTHDRGDLRTHLLAIASPAHRGGRIPSESKTSPGPSNDEYTILKALPYEYEYDRQG